jgi:hypothetical protein
MTPEQKSRQEIDRQLELAGWIVQDYHMKWIIIDSALAT